MTPSSTSLDGLDLVALDRHLKEVGIPRSGQLRGELISGGRSNLTFLVSDNASKWVLRRPPLHGLTPSAHDMAREYRVVAALQDTPVPVARAVTMRNDHSVLGAPFQMVEYVPGRVVRQADELESLGNTDAISDCVDALIKVLADLHAVDPEAVGLGDFGKPSGYLERQVRRWGSQWELVQRENDPCDTDVKRLHSALAEAIPPQSRNAVVHGDFRIDNTILDAEDATKVVAVLDWEMSTLGDPLSDAALMCVYRHPMFNLIMRARHGRRRLCLADDLAQRYALAADQSLDNWDFYMALGYFKVAIIAAGIAFRARMGGGVAADTDEVDKAVTPLIAAGLSALKVLPWSRRRGQALEAGLQVAPGGAAELDDPGRAAATVNRPPHTAAAESPRPAADSTASRGSELSGLGVLCDEDQQHHEDQETGDQRRPERCGPGEFDRGLGRRRRRRCRAAPIVLGEALAARPVAGDTG